MSTPIPKKLILHAGTHKTGTTAIQAGLARQAGFLKHRGYSQAVMHWDLLYLHQAFNPSEYGKTREDIDLGATRERFRAWAQQQTCETIILSGEAMTLFFWQGGKSHDEVGSYLFAGFADTTVVLYLRRQDTFLESAYQQRIKNGTTDTFEEFKNGAEADIYRNIDWHAKVSGFRKLFPHARFLVKLYEQACADGDIFRDFLTSIGIDPIPATVSTSRENQGLGDWQTELVRICNKHRQVEDRKTLIQVLSQGVVPARTDHLCLPRLRTEQRIKLLEHYHESNRRLFAAYDLGDLQQWERIAPSDRNVDDRVQVTDEPAALQLIDQLLAQAKADG